MTMAKKKSSVQKLIGFDAFTKNGIKTDRFEFVIFHVEPVNISVLPPEVIEAKIHDLTLVLGVIPELEIMALDSCECFDENKIFLQKRLREERSEAVRKLLEADLKFLDEIQLGMSTAREFLFIYRFHREKEEQIFTLINRVSKAISDHGFMAKRLSKSELKRMIALYFGSSVTGDEIPDTDIQEVEDIV